MISPTAPDQRRDRQAPPLAFRRRQDGLTYGFAPIGEKHGKPRWRRTDKALYVEWSPGRGWSVVDDDQTLLSRPWDIEPPDQGDLPPVGVWVSRKDDKAYVYDLILGSLPASAAPLRSRRAVVQATAPMAAARLGPAWST